MKKILLTCLVLLVILPIQNAHSFTYASKNVIAEHRLDLNGETYNVKAWFGFLSGLNIGDYATISGGPLTGEVTLSGPDEFKAGYYEFLHDWPEQVPSILSDFSNETYTFKLYDQFDNQIILDENPVTTKTGNMKWLPFVNLTATTGAGYTWLRWDDITGYGYINQYRVRVMNPDPSGPTIIADSMINGGKSSYTFSYYTEDLLSTYGEVIFRIEAIQVEEVDPGVWVWVNRSTLYHKVTLSCEGDFDGDGDVDGSDLATFAADFGRTDCP